MTAPSARAERRDALTEAVLTAGAIAGLLCLLASLVAVSFGITPLLFRSGSMQPTIGAGAVALAREVPADRIAEGDVVSVVDETGERLTHRVVAVEAVAGNSATLRLKGDANEAEDVRRYTVTEAERVFFHAEKVGYMLTWLSGPAAVFAAGLFSGVLLMIAFCPRGRRDDDPPAPPDVRQAPGPDPGLRSARPPGSADSASPRGGSPSHRLPPLVLLPAAVLVLATVPAPQARAADTDSAVVTSAAFSSRTEFLPRADQPFSSGAYVTCAVRTVGSAPDLVDLTWRHVGAPYLYRLFLRDLDGRVWRTWDVTSVPADAGDTVSYTITGAGMPRRSEIWQYDLEVHTMLPAPPVSTGQVSTPWRGIGIYQDVGSLWQEDLNCSLRGQQDRAAVEVFAPASVSCVSQPAAGLSQARATLSWPHVGSPHTYTVTVRDKNSGNVLVLVRVTSVPAQAGRAVTIDVSTLGLDLALRTSDAAVAEIRGVVSGVQSTAFVAQPLTVGLAAVSCASAPALRSAPQPSSSVTSPSVTSSSDTSAPSTSPSATSASPSPSQDARSSVSPSPESSAGQTASPPSAPPTTAEAPRAPPEPTVTTAESPVPEVPQAPPAASGPAESTTTTVTPDGS
ncbi:hypothetical protein [Nocardia higoensis]|uniref:hypothetical protein n=1 Tax=Nocardia higoensis TaxID=228599 RepID=UPI0002E43E39|nr:hypothetical protein [Nocardia higoensis]